jgi:anaerobic selenocysteine-containing dehydrogenase
VLEHFRTDTADYADYVLPATTQLEHVDVHGAYGHLYVVANQAAIAPLGEALPNSEIFRRLAAKMGYAETAFRESDDELAEQAFAPRGPTAKYDSPRLKQAGWERLDLPTRHAPFAAGNFATPSGRCEFRSESLARIGVDPLPAYVPPNEGPTSNPALAREFPLAMISPPARNFLNSSFVNVTSLRATEGEP